MKTKLLKRIRKKYAIYRLYNHPTFNSYESEGKPVFIVFDRRDKIIIPAFSRKAAYDILIKLIKIDYDSHFNKSKIKVIKIR